MKATRESSLFLSKYIFSRTNDIKIQLFRYFFVGGIAATVNISMLFLLTSLVGIFYLISNILAFLSGLIINYYLVKKYIFTDKTKISPRLEFFIYGLIGATGLIIDSMGLWFLTSYLDIYYLISKFISTVIVFLWNFFARKLLYYLIDGG